MTEIDDMLEQHFRRELDAAWHTSSHPLDGNLALATGSGHAHPTASGRETRRPGTSRTPRYISDTGIERALSSLYDHSPRQYAALRQHYTGCSLPYMLGSDALRQCVCRAKKWLYQHLTPRHKTA